MVAATTTTSSSTSSSSSSSSSPSSSSPPPLELPPPSMFRPPAELEAQLSRAAPLKPSPAELATGCTPSSTVCVVVVSHKASPRWVAETRYPVLAYKRVVTADGLYVLPNVWHEHAVYLHYICAFYDSLPPLSAFLHGHRSSWHNRGEPAISQLRELPLARLARERGVYLSFNNGRDTEYCIRAHLEPTQLRDWQREVRAQTHSWRRMMAADLGPPPAACGGYCCTQFLVSADRIRARPHSFWRRLLADLLDEATPAVCKPSGHLLELVWGYLLGEPANFTCSRSGGGSQFPAWALRRGGRGGAR